MNNREIKFRAWYGHKMHDHYEAMRLLYNEASGSSLNPVFQVMQFTGLKDKNGVDIYEGDIVHTYRNNQDGEWEVFPDGTGYVFYDTSDGMRLRVRTQTNFTPVFEGVGGIRHFEVIGNIHSNPELLK